VICKSKPVGADPAEAAARCEGERTTPIVENPIAAADIHVLGQDRFSLRRRRATATGRRIVPSWNVGDPIRRSADGRESMQRMAGGLRWDCNSKPARSEVITEPVQPAPAKSAEVF
jgi:hypothetical protein